jgi:hypothetical protein
VNRRDRQRFRVALARIAHVDDCEPGELRVSERVERDVERRRRRGLGCAARMRGAGRFPARA